MPSRTRPTPRTRRARCTVQRELLVLPCPARNLAQRSESSGRDRVGTNRRCLCDSLRLATARDPEIFRLSHIKIGNNLCPCTVLSGACGRYSLEFCETHDQIIKYRWYFPSSVASGSEFCRYFRAWLVPTLERKNFGGRSLGVGQLGRPCERKKKETKLRVVCARSTRLLDAHCIGASLSIEASVAYIHADCSFELLSHHLESSMYRMLEPRKRLKGIS